MNDATTPDQLQIILESTDLFERALICYRASLRAEMGAIEDDDDPRLLELIDEVDLIDELDLHFDFLNS
jgi:hypothetical protein